MYLIHFLTRVCKLLNNEAKPASIFAPPRPTITRPERKTFMKSTTDLSQVKAVATALLYTDIGETEFSPVVVQHPFTSSGMVALRTNGSIQIVDLTASEENLALWQKQMASIIDQCKSAFEVYNMVNKPYALTFVKYASPYLSQKDFAKILPNAWMRSENPNNDPNVGKERLVGLFRMVDRSMLMDKGEREQLDALPDPVTIYRGVTSYNANNIRALSWTLDSSKAEWFANRFGEHGTVFQARIDKRHILALFNGRDEAEIVVDPSYLENIEPYIGTAESFAATEEPEEEPLIQS